MRSFFNVKPREALLFGIFGLVYVIFQLAWAWGVADSIQTVGGLPGQSFSKIVIIGALTLLATLYAIVSMWLAWRSGSQGDSPAGLFMIKQGLAMITYICVGQTLAVALDPVVNLIDPNISLWSSPTQGIPVMYTLCLGGFIGLVVAGIGSDLIWRNKRAGFLAQGTRRR